MRRRRLRRECAKARGGSASASEPRLRARVMLRWSSLDRAADSAGPRDSSITSRARILSPGHLWPGMKSPRKRSRMAAPERTHVQGPLISRMVLSEGLLRFERPVTEWSWESCPLSGRRRARTSLGRVELRLGWLARVLRCGRGMTGRNQRHGSASFDLASSAKRRSRVTTWNPARSSPPVRAR